MQCAMVIQTLEQNCWFHCSRLLDCSIFLSWHFRISLFQLKLLLQYKWDSLKLCVCFYLVSKIYIFLWYIKLHRRLWSLALTTYLRDTCIYLLVSLHPESKQKAGFLEHDFKTCFDLVQLSWKQTHSFSGDLFFFLFLFFF
jgi:hypothetical protein